jgi:hypothetical protein
MSDDSIIFSFFFELPSGKERLAHDEPSSILLEAWTMLSFFALGSLLLSFLKSYRVTCFLEGRIISPLSTVYDTASVTE